MNKMITTFASAIAPASVTRGRLKHSWLENEVLNKTPEIIVALRHEVSWPELQRFPADARQALALADEVEYGFSPARLVDDCAPLAVLPEEERVSIRKAVHAAYLECFDAPGIAQTLRAAAVRMQVALSALLDEWSKPDTGISNAELQARWRIVLAQAAHLRNALDALPNGVVLP